MKSRRSRCGSGRRIRVTSARRAPAIAGARRGRGEPKRVRTRWRVPSRGHPVMHRRLRFVRLILPALILLLLGLPARAQPGNTVREHYVKREVEIPMRDGVKLFTSIYAPKDSSKPA